MTWRKRLAEWINPAPPTRPCPYVHGGPRKRWTGAKSLTEQAIIGLLTSGPMTRKEMDLKLDVTTSGQILPELVKRGLIRKTDDRVPAIYELVPNAPADESVSE